MSVIIALKQQGNVYVGADDKCIIEDNIQSDDVSKIRQLEDCGTVIGVAGYYRDFNIIEGIDMILPPDSILCKTFVINNIVPYLYNLYGNSYRVEDDNGIKYFLSEFLIADRDHIFSIGCDGAVQEHKKYAVLGSGCNFVRGYFDTISDWSDPYKLIETAISKSCNKDVYVGNTANIITI